MATLAFEDRRKVCAPATGCSSPPIAAIAWRPHRNTRSGWRCFYQNGAPLTLPRLRLSVNCDRSFPFPITLACLSCPGGFGGHTAAALYTVLASAKRHRLEPWEYLRDLFIRLPTMTVSELPDLLPDRWVKGQGGDK